MSYIPWVMEAVFVIFVVIGVWVVILSFYNQWFDRTTMLMYIRQREAELRFQAQPKPFPKKLRNRHSRHAATWKGR